MDWSLFLVLSTLPLPVTPVGLFWPLSRCRVLRGRHALPFPSGGMLGSLSSRREGCAGHLLVVGTVETRAASGLNLTSLNSSSCCCLLICQTQNLTLNHDELDYHLQDDVDPYLSFESPQHACFSFLKLLTFH